MKNKHPKTMLCFYSSSYVSDCFFMYLLFIQCIQVMIILFLLIYDSHTSCVLNFCFVFTFIMYLECCYFIYAFMFYSLFYLTIDVL